MKKVVLDPGHGVETAGKRSPDGTYLEHEFNLDMARRLKAQLERHGVCVTLTRSDEHDVTLARRVALSNSVQPELFVSLHSNASGAGWTDPSGYGIYTSAAGEAERNRAAKTILARVREAGVTLWGGGLHHNIELYVLRRTAAPAVLIEHGFHTNRAEVERLKTGSYRDLLARADAKGILDHLGIVWVEEATQSQGSVANGVPGKAESFVGERPSSEVNELSPSGGSEGYGTCEAVCPHCGGTLKIEKG